MSVQISVIRQVVLVQFATGFPFTKSLRAELLTTLSVADANPPALQLFFNLADAAPSSLRVSTYMIAIHHIEARLVFGLYEKRDERDNQGGNMKKMNKKRKRKKE